MPPDALQYVIAELKSRHDNQLIMLTASNKSFMVTASYLLDLAQRAHELFSNASERLQQKMLKTVLSNIELFDKKLTYIVNDPYKTFIEINKKTLDGSKSEIWCA